MEERRKHIVKEVIEFAAIIFVFFFCFAVLKFYGQCAAWLSLTACVILIFLYSWFFDKEYQDRITRSSFRTFAAVGRIILVLVLLLVALAMCT